MQDILIYMYIYPMIIDQAQAYIEIITRFAIRAHNHQSTPLVPRARAFNAEYIFLGAIFTLASDAFMCLLMGRGLRWFA